MNRIFRTLTPFAVALVGASAIASEADLAKRIAEKDGWVGWQVPIVENAGFVCCFDLHRQGASSGSCDLDGRNLNIGTIDDDGPQPEADALKVYVHTTHGRIDKARAFTSSCKIRGEDQVRWLDPVSGADSVAFLGASAANAPKELVDSEITALALHADMSATTTLAQLADASHARNVREPAVFWLGQKRGADGAKFVEHIATTDGDPAMRSHAVFALSESRAIDAYASIHRIAQTDASDHVREQALFWMAQMGDKRAKDDIFAAIRTEKSDSVREQAVFALSQLKDGEADAALIAVVKGDYPRKAREQALFWLGESGSTQAMDFLDDVLTRSTPKAAKH
jgi:HEAT repeat protein